MRSSSIIVACVLGALGVGCTSVQWMASNGDVRIVGWGHATAVPTEGGVVTRVVAPGLSLGLVPDAQGWTAGYRASTIYQSVDASGGRETIARSDVGYGIVIGPGSITVGAEREFGIVMPAAERSVEQEIHFEDGEPSADWLRRREVE